MMFKYSLAVIVALVAIALAVRLRPPVDPMKTNGVIVERMLRAVERQDYDAFIVEGDRSVRKMRIELFRNLAERQGPRLRQAHTLQALDGRWRGEVYVSRWKLIFKDGGPDAIVTLGVRDGKVATFALY